MVKTRSFKNNEEYFKFINNSSLKESIIIRDLKLVDGKYVMRYEDIPNENEKKSTDEVECPSTKKQVGNKNNRKPKKKKIKN